MLVAISAPTPQTGGGSETTTAAPVLRTDAVTVSLSHGESVRRSTTSASTPSAESVSAACSATWRMAA